MDNKLFDSIDMRNERRMGYFLGFTTGTLSTFIVGVLVGMFYYS